MAVPAERLRAFSTLPTTFSKVVYWMTSARRMRFNFALQHAVDLAADAGVPLLVFEPLRLGYPHASARFHRFAMDGMADNAAACAAAGVAYYPFIEQSPGAGKGLLAALGDGAIVVGDDNPSIFYPRMLRSAAKQVDLVAVDGNGLYPYRHTDRTFTVAHSFRRHLQKELLPFLNRLPEEAPLERYAALKLPRANLPDGIEAQWPRASEALLNSREVPELPIDHSVAPAERGGSRRAGELLKRFLSDVLPRYAADRNEPDLNATSLLSPFLHFGHIASAEVFSAIAKAENWSTAKLGVVNGKRHDWWGMSENAEAFLDQLITWRELGFNACHLLPHYDRYCSLPDWAKATLDAHRGDPRPKLYSLEELEFAQTSDELWNAAQRELTQTGRMQNYLRMLWGKRILEWSKSPEEAAERMVHLNDKYALDGRDPNSYSGIFWTLGRYDRPWGPERPIFGKVRYMSSANTHKKRRLGQYLKRFGQPPVQANMGW